MKTRVLSDNGKAFTDRLFGLRKRAATGEHEFDLLCSELGIEHRLTPPMHPQTNGMVERFNGRIEDVLQSHRFQSGEDLEQTILRYVHLYNSQLPQSALKGQTPIRALKEWKRQRPELFKKHVYNHAGCDTYENPPDLVDWLAAEMTAHGITPEVESFDLSHILQAIAMHEAGKIPGELYVQFVMGVKNAMPADKTVFDFYVKLMAERVPQAHWCAAGIGCQQIVVNE